MSNQFELSSSRHTLKRVIESNGNPTCVINCLTKIIEQQEKSDKKVFSLITDIIKRIESLSEKIIKTCNEIIKKNEI